MFSSPFDDVPDRYLDRHPGHHPGHHPDGDHQPYPGDDPFQWRPDAQDRLRHLVFLDGRLVDAWVEPVEGTAYLAQARRLDREAAPAPAHVPVPPPHEQLLGWLDDVVGGRIALLALDDDPLVPVEPPTGAGDAYAAVVERLALVNRVHFDEEFHRATCVALGVLRRLAPWLLGRDPAEVAGGLCWVVGRANGRVGAGTPVTQAVLKRELGVTGSMSSRAGAYRDQLRDLRPPSPHHRPQSCPDLLALGRSDVLTAATRREVIRLRDRALDAATRAAADEHARASTSLT
jgi:hypothetical protein